MHLPIDLARARWRKAARSSASGSDCVEIAGLEAWIAVRDSKDPDGPFLLLERTAWQKVARAIAEGRADL
ncbi:DUF397 domain-containing protein [Actinomadura sp. SCN-SB]|uniref:DUF397 domain-containing protein n=1 Tax=Actinomadura sp. SCN-SB TaxID=3373092 RepID=UPI0037528FAB